MLPAAPSFAAEQAQRWRAAAWPVRFVRTGLPLLWLTAVVVAVAAPVGACTPEDPSRCGPDPLFAIAFTFCLATPVLLVWMPLAGCAAGVLYGLAEIRYDPDSTPRAAFALHAALCLVGALWLHASRQQQDAIAREASAGRLVGVPAELRAGVQLSWRLPRLIATLVLAISGVASLAWYQHELHEEQAHLAHAVVEDARVVGVNGDDYTVTVETGDELTGKHRRTIDVLDTGDYAVGQDQPIRTDPGDPTWVRLLSEPDAQDSWLGTAVGAWLLGAALLGRELARRRAIQDLLAGDQHALSLRADPNAYVTVELAPADADTPLFARFVTGWNGRSTEPEEPSEVEDPWERDEWDDVVDAEDSDAFGRYWRGEDDRPEEDDSWEPPPPREAVHLGPLRYGAWSLLLVDDALHLPSRPLTWGTGDSLRGLRERWRHKRDLDETADRPAPLTPAPPGTELTPPISAGPSAQTRRLGALLVLAGVVGAPLGLFLLLPSHWLPAIGFVLTGGQALIGGTHRMVQGITIERQELRISDAWRTHRLPWDYLHGIRQHGDRLLVACKPVDVISVGPFAPAGCASTQERATQLGRTMLRLREQALAAGDPQREAWSTGNLAWRLLFFYAAEIAITLWLFA